MTRTSQRQTPPRDSSHLQPPQQPGTTTPQNASLHPGVDSASDGDAGERPVREKLKKTSIASIPRYGIVSASENVEGPADEVMDAREKEDQPIEPEENTNTRPEERGRPVRKRSLEDLDTVDTGKSGTRETNTEPSSGQARKRSRDVRSVASLNTESRRMSLENPLQEEIEEPQSNIKLQETGDVGANPSVEANTPTSDAGAADEEMQESILSPRKKRSRDQFEAESQREQKIAATDETRARRRSSEEERRNEDQTKDTGLASGEPKQNEQNGHINKPGEPFRETQPISSTTKISPTSGFANSSTISPFGTLASSKSDSTTNTPTIEATTTQPIQTSSSAFASSGFAALASSTISPFGTGGTRSTASGKSPSHPPASEAVMSPFGVMSSSTTHIASSSGSGPATSAFARAGPSSFASLNNSGFSALGGSAFGSAFGSGFGGGSKLSSFAAPKGDLNTAGEKPKTFGGGGATSDGGDSGSDEGGDDNPEAATSDGHEVESNKFQMHETDTGEEGEDTIFQNRGKLYRFDKGAWSERGQGIFKLNITRRDTKDFSGDTEDSVARNARFIMRTHATHRVVLNAPIFKEMLVGDPQGKEPTGKKTLSFSVPVDGRLEPHMLKMGKEDDVKTLWREVKALQKTM